MPIPACERSLGLTRWQAVAEHVDASLISHIVAEENVHQRGLAGTILTQQPKNFTFRFNDQARFASLATRLPKRLVMFLQLEDGCHSDANCLILPHSRARWRGTLPEGEVPTRLLRRGDPPRKGESDETFTHARLRFVVVDR